MPYLIFTIYNLNHGENLLPRIYRIPKSKINNYHDFRYRRIREEIERDLMKDYKGAKFDEVYFMDEFILDKIPLYGERAE